MYKLLEPQREERTGLFEIVNKTIKYVVCSFGLVTQAVL